LPFSTFNWCHRYTSVKTTPATTLVEASTGGWSSSLLAVFYRDESTCEL